MAAKKNAATPAQEPKPPSPDEIRGVVKAHLERAAVTPAGCIMPDPETPGEGDFDAVVFPNPIPVGTTPHRDAVFLREQGWTMREPESGRLTFEHARRGLRFQWVGAGYVLVLRARTGETAKTAAPPVTPATLSLD